VPLLAIKGGRTAGPAGRSIHSYRHCSSVGSPPLSVVSALEGVRDKNSRQPITGPFRRGNEGPRSGRTAYQPVPEKPGRGISTAVPALSGRWPAQLTGR